MMPRVLAFGDEYGLPRLLPHLPPGALVGIVASALRPACLERATALAARADVPIAIQPRSGAAEYQAFLRQVCQLQPDFMIVHSYAQRLPTDLLACAHRAALNVHSALLPRYRGPNPIQWAMICGERETGVTLHHLSEEFDAGDIVDQRAVPIAFEDTWKDVVERIDVAADTLLAETLPAVFAGRSGRTPQDPRRASVFQRRRPEDGRIDWRSSVIEIYNLIRALVSPLPGAFYERNGTRIVIDSFRKVGDVVSLKFGETGQARLESGATRLIPYRVEERSRLIAAGLPASPDGDEEPGQNRLMFLVVDRGGRLLGSCGWSIDWSSNAATVAMRWTEDAGARWLDVERLVRLVARDELRLTTVRVDGPSQHVLVDVNAG